MSGAPIVLSAKVMRKIAENISVVNETLFLWDDDCETVFEFTRDEIDVAVASLHTCFQVLSTALKQDTAKHRKAKAALAAREEP